MEGVGYQVRSIQLTQAVADLSSKDVREYRRQSLIKEYLEKLFKTASSLASQADT